MIEIGVSLAPLRARFTTEIPDKILRPKLRRFFDVAGGAIRKTARRSLRKARQTPVSQLTDGQRRRYNIQLNLFRDGKLQSRPRRPDMISEPGKPPRLHMQGSPLKTKLNYGVILENRSVVVGPEKINGTATRARRTGLDSLQDLEERRPFMAPALAAVQPRLPEYLGRATR
jgi:hypothetical protein